jgi:glycerol-3-phosphate acyltransferase PlsY
MSDFSAQQAIVSAAVGYLLGAIPTGMIVARVYRNVDLPSPVTFSKV